MKYTLLLLSIFALPLFSSCEDNGDPIGESLIEVPTNENMSELDLYIYENLTVPYNIQVQYEFDVNEVSPNRFLFPPEIENVKPVVDLLLDVWIKPYEEVGGETFIKEVAPRLFTIVGSYNTNPEGTITLGLAEGGVKISFFNVDYLDFTDEEQLRANVSPLKTIQHEYGHILNQSKPIPPVYETITPSEYTAQWFNRTDEEAKELGFISAYASNQPKEDFVEMLAVMLTHTNDEWNEIINAINSNEAKEALREKEAVLVDYFLENWDVDLYALQDKASVALSEFVENY